jgi:2-polyprenyl-3-methyl-5-hydroxy-6-metoxy-1,4-benzoquinol methylase
MAQQRQAAAASERRPRPDDGSQILTAGTNRAASDPGLQAVHADIEDVRKFWEANPLWTGESRFPAGSREFFDEHLKIVIDDCFAGSIDERIFPPASNRNGVLDLGCGPGLWTIELSRRGCTGITAADLTENALLLAGRRCETYGVIAAFSRQNAERMTFQDGAFSHVNCQGVIHHTPDTESCVREIARVLRPGGTATVSVYYRNFFLRQWRLLRPLGSVLARLGADLKGRGREGLFAMDDVDDIVRRYDGGDNPIGKSYSRDDFVRMLQPFFRVEETYLHFFPARTLPFRLPGPVHRFLDRRAGFMIYARLTKK